MKVKFYILIAMFCMPMQKALAQCITATLTTQGEVDAFVSTYGCSTLSGRLTIKGKDITRLDSLWSITSVGGLSIDSTGLINLQGLGQLTTVNGTMSITNNNELNNIDALSNVTTVRSNQSLESITITNNQSLQRINGLSGLRQLVGSLVLARNAALKNLDGLDSLRKTLGLIINNNESLTNIDGLHNLASAAVNVEIAGNPLLENVDGLISLKDIGPDRRSARLTIVDNASLTNINGLASLEKLSGLYNYLNISHNPALTEACSIASLLKSNLGCFCENDMYIENEIYVEENGPGVTFQNIVSTCAPRGDCTKAITLRSQAEVSSFPFTNGCSVLASDLVIEGTDITSLHHLNQITSIGGNLRIDVSGLTDLNGLEELQNIGGLLGISKNDVLTNIDALRNLRTIGTYYVSDQSVNIQDNPVLENIHGLSGLRTLPGGLSITNNGSLRNLDGLDSIDNVGSLVITNNDSLFDINALQKIPSIRGHAVISDNYSLQNIDGLISLREITSLRSVSNLTISNNSSLVNINGLASLRYLLGPQKVFNLTKNPKLVEACAILELLRTSFACPNCDALLTISDNGPGVTYESILTGCVTNENRRCDINFLFSSQAQVNAFKRNYGCTVVEGYIYLIGPDITNIDSLSTIQKVKGLDIQSTKVAHLNGLSNLTEVTGTSCRCNEGLQFYNNQELTDIAGLSSLHKVTGRLVISGSPLLSNLHGLEYLESISDGFELDHLSNLQTLRGLSGLKVVGTQDRMTTQIVITSTGITDLHGLEGLTSIQGSMDINNNPGLTSLDGLDNIRYVTRNTASSGGTLFVSNNSALENVNGLSGIETIASELRIISNRSLKELDGLHSLRQVGSDSTDVAGISITDNDSLENVDGLINLEKIIDWSDVNWARLKITDNQRLERFCGLYTVLSRNGISGCDDADCERIVIAGNAVSTTVAEILSGGTCTTATEPGQPTNITFSDVTDTTMTVTFTGSQDADGYIAIMRSFEPSHPVDAPIDGEVYHVGQVIGYSSIVVSVSQYTVLDIVYLTPGIEYWFDVYSYKYNGIYNYVTTSPLEGVQRTMPRIDCGGAWPNPFVESVTIPFTTSTDDHVRIVIFDSMGANIAEVTNQLFSAGSHDVVWNGTDRFGAHVPKGIYFYHVLKSNGNITGRITK